MAVSTRARTPSSEAQSPGTAVPPISSATACAASASRSLTTTRAPSAASRVASARPMPCPAPVTTAPRPSRPRGAGHQTPPVRVTPPSRVTVWPVTQEASSESRNATAPATSSGSPSRLSGYAADDLGLAALVERGGEGGLDDGGGDRVDADPGSELDGERLGEADHHRLGRAVHRDHGGRLHARDGRDVDDRAAVLAHPGPVGGLHPGERAEGVDLDDLAGRGEVELDQRAVDRVDAGVVDEQVEAAEGLDGAAYGVLAVRGVVGLAGHGDRVVGAAERGDGLVERLGLARGQADPGALLDEPLGDAQADAPAGAGDDRGLAGEAPHGSGPISGYVLMDVLPAGSLRPD